MDFDGNRNIVVIDPGLMEAGGHHAGLAAVVASSSSRPSSVKIEFVSHECVDQGLKQQLERADCRIWPFFASNFYQYFDQVVRVTEIQVYILQLAKEYVVAIQSAVNRHFGEELLFFYPSLGWEHAYCLALALKYLRPMSHVKHIVCAMFNPGVNFKGQTVASVTKLHYSLGFKALDKSGSVQIYVSDAELAWQYGSLLGRSEPLPIHPCYLADWAMLKTERDNNVVGRPKEVARVILFMGDAKENKGFCRIPDIAKQILSDLALNIELVVHYTSTWANEKITAIVDELKELAATDNRLLVCDKFLSDESVHAYLKESDLYIFTYETSAYQNKSSGFLWLIGWYEIPAMFLNTTWLNREAARIGLPVVEHDDWECIQENISAKALHELPELTRVRLYREQLYRPFWGWITML